jgi:hypothetical protein
MVQWTILVIAGLLAAAAEAAVLPAVGEPIAVEGRIDQIDRGTAPSAGVWLRMADDQAVVVRGSGGATTLAIGTRMRAEGTRGEDLVQVARDGRTRHYPVVLATGPLLAMPETSIKMWMPALLGGLLVVFLVLAILFGRRPPRRRSAGARGRLDDLDAHWSTLDPGDLPADPIDALAEMARRADEEDQA